MALMWHCCKMTPKSFQGQIIYENHIIGNWVATEDYCKLGQKTVKKERVITVSVIVKHRLIFTIEVAILSLSEP